MFVTNKPKFKMIEPKFNESNILPREGIHVRWNNNLKFSLEEKIQIDLQKKIFQCK